MRRAAPRGVRGPARPVGRPPAAGGPPSSSVSRRVRPAAVAGSFYPADPDALRDAIRRSFADARPAAPDAVPPKALVVPHAGFVYSGPIAASAYARVAPARSTIP